MKVNYVDLGITVFIFLSALQQNQFHPENKICEKLRNESNLLIIKRIVEQQLWLGPIRIILVKIGSNILIGVQW